MGGGGAAQRWQMILLPRRPGADVLCVQCFKNGPSCMNVSKYDSWLLYIDLYCRFIWRLCLEHFLENWEKVTLIVIIFSHKLRIEEYEKKGYIYILYIYKYTFYICKKKNIYIYIYFIYINILTSCEKKRITLIIIISQYYIFLKKKKGKTSYIYNFFFLSSFLRSWNQKLLAFLNDLKS